MGVVMDAQTEALRQGIESRFPGKGTPTSLGYIGLDKVTPRGFNEGDDHYAVRLRLALDDWHRAGLPGTIINQIYGIEDPWYGFVCTIDGASNWSYLDKYGQPYTYNAQGTSDQWDWDVFDSGVGNWWWWRSWVVIAPTDSVAPLFPSTREIGASLTLGDGSLIGFNPTVTDSDLGALRATIKQWKPEHEDIIYILIVQAEGVCVPGGVIPDGYWHHWGKDNGISYTAARSTDVCYVSMVGA